MISDNLSVRDGHLYIGGCDTVKLAEKYGTPLYVMDEDKIRDNCRKYVKAFEDYYKGSAAVVYVSKAFSCKEMCRIVISEGLDLEVVSGGELYTALSAGVPSSRIHFQGNNKTMGEVHMAIENNVGEIVIDNLTELRNVQRLAKEYNGTVTVSVRVNPGVEAHTHEFLQTGQLDSKFGTAIETGAAFELIKEALQQPNLKVRGLHCHIGSQIFDTRPFTAAVKKMLEFFAEIKTKLGAELSSLNLGGGLGINYVKSDDAPDFDEYVREISKSISKACDELGLELPDLSIEPGRSIAGNAGLTLYTVGDVKEISGVRNYTAIDGGMFESPRYALYNAEYTVVLADKMNESADYETAIAGKCCESGDLIQKNAVIQKPEAGDIMAVLVTGAYNYSMASNYNRNLKSPVVMVSNGKPRIAVRGETYEDLIRNDI